MLTFQVTERGIHEIIYRQTCQVTGFKSIGVRFVWSLKNLQCKKLKSFERYMIEPPFRSQQLYEGCLISSVYSDIEIDTDQMSL